MKNLLNLKGVKTLNKREQSKVKGGNPWTEGCDVVCANTVANYDAFSKVLRYACSCTGGANDPSEEPDQ